MSASVHAGIHLPLGADTPSHSRTRHPPEHTPPSSGADIPQSRHPPGSRHPPRSRHPPGAYTLWSKNPLGADTPWEQTPPGSRYPLEQTLPRSRHSPGKQTAAYSQRAAGTHPAGMHSCSNQVLSKIEYHINTRMTKTGTTNLQSKYTGNQEIGKKIKE